MALVVCLFNTSTPEAEAEAKATKARKGSKPSLSLTEK